MPVSLGLLSLAGAPTDGVNEVQTIVLTGTPTGGTFTITYAGQTTDPLAYNASPGAVMAAMEALSNIGTGNVQAAGGPLPGTLLEITFIGELAGLAVDEITATTTELTAPDPTVVTIATTVPGSGAVDEEQTVLLPNATGGTFTLTFDGQTTAALAYNVSNANLKAGLEALTNIDADAITISGGPLPALTTVIFDNGNVALTDVAQMTASGASLTRALGATIATTAAGARATFRGAPAGTLLQDTTNGLLYQNTGTELRPVWDDVSTLSTWP